MFCNKSISKLKVLVNKSFDLHVFHITVVQQVKNAKIKGAKIIS